MLFLCKCTLTILIRVTKQKQKPTGVDYSNRLKWRGIVSPVSLLNNKLTAKELSGGKQLNVKDQQSKA